MICTAHQYYLGYHIKNETDPHVAVMGERRDAYRVLVGKSEGKGTLRRHWGRQKGYIKMDLQEVEWGMDQTDLAQDTYVIQW